MDCMFQLPVHLAVHCIIEPHQFLPQLRATPLDPLLKAHNSRTGDKEQDMEAEGKGRRRRGMEGGRKGKREGVRKGGKAQLV